MIMKLLILITLHLSLLTTVLSDYGPYFEWNFDPVSCATGSFDTTARDGLRFEADIQGSCRRDLGFTYNEDTSHDVLTLSQNSSETVFEKIEALGNGFAVSLWVKPNITDSFPRPIIRIGKSTPNLGHIEDCEIDGVDFMLTQQGPDLVVTIFSLEEGNGPFDWPCEKFLLKGVAPPNELSHIFVSISESSQAIYINGRSIFQYNASTPDSFSYSFRDKAVQLFNHGQDRGPFYGSYKSWQGTMFQMSILPALQAEDELISILSKGLPPTPPIPSTTQVVLLEDAEIEAESHPAEWYQNHPTVTESSRVILWAEYLQDDLMELLLGLNLTLAHPPTPVYFFIVSIPSGGQLFSAEGGILEENSKLSTFSSSGPSEIVYIPPLNKHSGTSVGSFTNFTYCVSSVPFFSPDQCLESNVGVHIIPVNDPPIPIPIPEVTVRESVVLTSSALHLTGEDVDEGDTIKRVRISQSPKYGTLLMSVTQYREDEIVDATTLESLNNTVDSRDPVYVKYSWNPHSFENVVTDEGVVDNFEFQVQDNNGAWSKAENVQIRIVPAVTLLQNETYVCNQEIEHSCELSLIVDDSSSLQRDVGVMIDSLPAANTGTLKHVHSGDSLLPTTKTNTVSFPYSEPLVISFMPNATLCDGKRDYQTSFAVRVFANDNLGKLTSLSQPYSRRVHVRCPERSVSLKQASRELDVIATNLLDNQDIPCAGSPFNFSADCQKLVYLGDFAALDKVAEDTLLRVNITVGRGFLSFSRNSWDYIQPYLGRLELAGKHVSFSTTRKLLTHVLSAISYQVFREGNDYVQVQVSREVCHSEATCEMETLDFNISASSVPETGTATAKNMNEFPWHVLACAFGYPLIYYSLFRINIGIRKK